MAKGRNKRKARKTATLERFLRPTEAREAHNDFEGAGAAVRVIPVIETLLFTNRITREQFDALDYYREQAHKAEDDAKQAGTLDPERIMGGISAPCGGRIPAIMLATPAMIETARIEGDVGNALRPILQAVVRDDMTLTKWCISQHGGRERYDKAGNVIAIVPIGEKRVMAQALLELKYAAGAIVR